MNPETLRQAILIVALSLVSSILNGQLNINELTGSSSDGNPINTAVPFLTIAPDGRAAGMGDLGAASTPDISSQHWNVAKYAFIEGKGGAAFTYRPWLTRVIPDFDHFYLSGYYKHNHKNTFSASLRYFSLGTHTFGGIGLTPINTFQQREFALDAGYSRKFSENFSGGIVLRYIHSDLSAGQLIIGEESNPGTSLATDLGLYYENSFLIGEKDALWALGMSISNLGSPISYTADAAKVPIPTNLRLGGRISYEIIENHSISLMADANKYLVPTPPLYGLDTITGDYNLLFGSEAPETVLAGVFQSFYDAPGILFSDGTHSSVLREELAEIMISIGTEYWYKDLFAMRMGYFHQSDFKGGRKYMTFGFSASWRFLTFDGAYLLPIEGSSSPLAKTISLSLAVELKGK